MDDSTTTSQQDSPDLSYASGDASLSVPTPLAGTPDYLPARMLNEFVYCPRLFYYEWVDGIFVESRDTVAGTLRHEKLERKEDALPFLRSHRGRQDDPLAIGHALGRHAPTHREARPDRRRGGRRHAGRLQDWHPRRNDDKGQITVWDADRVQLGAQALVLRGNGYQCDEGVIYHVATKQRVRVSIDDDLVRETLDALRRARVAASGPLPPPLIGSPKCPRCSLVGVCLPDETRVCVENGRSDLNDDPPAIEVRRLVPARDDLKPLYLNIQGFRVGKSGEVLQIHGLDKKAQEVRFNEPGFVASPGHRQDQEPAHASAPQPRRTPTPSDHSPERTAI